MIPCKLETIKTKLPDMLKAGKEHPQLNHFENNGVTLAFMGRLTFCTHLKCLENKMGECVRITKKREET